MTSEPMEAPRCTATARSGERCKRRPVPGLNVCVMHGGKTPAAQAKAEQRVAEAKADATIRALLPKLTEVEAVKDPVASMGRLAGVLEQFLDEVSGKVNDLKHLAAGDSLSQLRGEVVLWERVASMLGRLLDAMARLGIAERQVEVQQAQVEIMLAGWRAALDALHRDIPGGLTPPQRDLVVRVFLTEIGRPPTELETGVPA